MNVIALVIFLMPFFLSSMQKPETSKAPEPTHYEILDISRNATQQEIKKAYYKLSKMYHPDKCQGKSIKEQTVSEEKYKNITHSYSVLSDENEKSTYDATLPRTNTPEPESAQAAAAQAPPSTSQPASNPANDGYRDVQTQERFPKKILEALKKSENVSQEEKNFALIYFMRYANLPECKGHVLYIISQNAEIRLRNDSRTQETLLYYAIDLDNFELVEFLLKNGINPNETSSKETRPLWLAKSQRMARLLIEAEADIRLKGPDSNWPLLKRHIIYHKDEASVDTLQYLLECGADPLEEDNFKNNALHWLISALKNVDLEIAQKKVGLLLSYGVSLHTWNKHQDSAMRVLEREVVLGYVGSKYEKFKKFIDKWQEINPAPSPFARKKEPVRQEPPQKSDSCGFTFSDQERGANRVINLLLLGEPVSQQEKNEAFIYFMEHLSLGINKENLLYLLLLGADISAKNDNNEGIVHFAVKGKDCNFLAEVLSRGAEALEKNKQGRNALDMLMTHKVNDMAITKKMALLLFKRGVQLNESVYLLKDLDAVINLRTSTSSTYQEFKEFLIRNQYSN